VNICVYCASSISVSDVYRDATAALGRLIAERDHALVYGGTQLGLMGILARAAKEAGGRVVGVIPRRMMEHDIAYLEADEMILTETMAERKAAMEARSDAFVALPGGFGTLEEVAQVITLKQLRYVEGPIVLLNTAGFYDHLLAHLEHLYRTGFAYPIYRQVYTTVATPVEAIEYVETYRPVAMPDKWEPPSC
jgi:cytokinin riboside 5'-monophosphate phosphoribohydrolase